MVLASQKGLVACMFVVIITLGWAPPPGTITPKDAANWMVVKQQNHEAIKFHWLPSKNGPGVFFYHWGGGGGVGGSPKF